MLVCRSDLYLSGSQLRTWANSEKEGGEPMKTFLRGV